MNLDEKSILDFIKKKGMDYNTILGKNTTHKTELEKVTKQVLDLCKSGKADFDFLKSLMIHVNDKYNKLPFIIAYYNHDRSEEFCEFMLKLKSSSILEEFLVGIMSWQNLLARYYDRTDKQILLRVIDNKHTDHDVLKKLKSHYDPQVVKRAKSALYSVLE